MSYRSLQEKVWLEAELYMMQVKENPHPCFSPQFFAEVLFLRVQNKKFGDGSPAQLHQTS